MFIIANFQKIWSIYSDQQKNICYEKAILLNIILINHNNGIWLFGIINIQLSYRIYKRKYYIQTIEKHIYKC